ncbi:hypothetical protein [Cognatishimia activa]|uniref:Uncharacterized protein n=1 Tax=Cognatishimia activa TaxID=1715691 RepID=A0A0P1J595_9RHOB|nr:hypothetical protein [Cognatishimia activa]CUI26328.1 hypothetical protein TA5113_00009 [Cognatishimia activa]CUK25179.1 hypothetical protein TA5114_00970 [Cognatishimia activa]
MKRILATSAAALVVLTGAASAMTAASAYEDTLKRYAPDVDLSQVSNAAIHHAVNAINDDGDATFVQTQHIVQSILENG